MSFTERLNKAAEDLCWCGCNDDHVRDTYHEAIKEIRKVANELEEEVRPAIAITIDPGEAGDEVINKLCDELSALHEALGGSGLKLEVVDESKGEPSQVEE